MKTKKQTGRPRIYHYDGTRKQEVYVVTEADIEILKEECDQLAKEKGLSKVQWGPEVRYADFSKPIVVDTEVAKWGMGTINN